MLYLVVDNTKELQDKGLSGMLRTSNPVFLVKDGMDGSKEAIYHINLVDQLDEVFIKNSMDYLGIEQERYITRFFKQADVVTDKINGKNINPYNEMDDVMKQLDNFLGSYFGVEYGRFTR